MKKGRKNLNLFCEPFLEPKFLHVLFKFQRNQQIRHITFTILYVSKHALKRKLTCQNSHILCNTRRTQNMMFQTPKSILCLPWCTVFAPSLPQMINLINPCVCMCVSSFKNLELCLRMEQRGLYNCNYFSNRDFILANRIILTRFLRCNHKAESSQVCRDLLRLNWEALKTFH